MQGPRHSPTRHQGPAEEGNSIPEQTLIVAILKQAVRDARGVRHSSARRTPQRAALMADAREFLTDSARIAYFAALYGAEVDSERLQARLLHAAGVWS